MSEGCNDFYECDYRNHKLSILVVGASGDLAAKKTFPSLLALFKGGYLPKQVVIVGFARSKKSDDDFRKQLAEKMTPGGAKDDKVDEFLRHVIYRSGDSYSDEKAYTKVYEEVAKLEDEAPGLARNRMFYFAVPPSIFAETAGALKNVARTDAGWNRCMFYLVLACLLIHLRQFFDVMFTNVTFMLPI
jgi:glucose-6-phosphate 1-dehydrogenase